MFTRKFWRETLERAISSAAEAMVAVVPLAVFDFLSGSAWVVVGVVGAGSFIVTVLKCLAATKIGNPESPSLTQ